MWKGARTLWQVCGRLFTTYDQVNKMFFKNGMRDRIDGLAGVTGRNIQEAVRIDATRLEQSVELARAFTHLLAVMSEFEPTKGGVSGAQSAFVRWLTIKWGTAVCIFCDKISCKCKDRRRRVVLTTQLPAELKDRLSWSVRQWQQFLHGKYYKRNHEKGIDFVVGRLNNEVIELLNVWRDVGKNLRATPSDVLAHYAEESADVFAWLLGVANLLEVDLEDAVAARYPNGGCHTCFKSPCGCEFWKTRGIQLAELEGLL